MLDTLPQLDGDLTKIDIVESPVYGAELPWTLLGSTKNGKRYVLAKVCYRAHAYEFKHILEQIEIKEK